MFVAHQKQAFQEMTLRHLFSVARRALSAHKISDVSDKLILTLNNVHLAFSEG